MSNIIVYISHSSLKQRALKLIKKKKKNRPSGKSMFSLKRDNISQLWSQKAETPQSIYWQTSFCIVISFIDWGTEMGRKAHQGHHFTSPKESGKYLERKVFGDFFFFIFSFFCYYGENFTEKARKYWSSSHSNVILFLDLLGKTKVECVISGWMSCWVDECWVLLAYKSWDK